MQGMRIKQMMTALRARPIAPRLCFLCAADSDHFICRDCQADLPGIPHCCPQCSLPLLQSALCPECQSMPPSFTTSISAFAYADAVPFLIKQFKQHRHLGCGQFLTSALCNKIDQHYQRHHNNTAPHLITCTPLHWTTAFSRQFNQAEVIARQLANHLSIAYAPLLTKTQRSPSQKQLKRKQRLRNLRQSYALTNNARSTVKGKHIALVDDVMTTGATAESVSKRLVAAGANQVDIWILARTPKSE